MFTLCGISQSNGKSRGYDASGSNEWTSDCSSPCIPHHCSCSEREKLAMMTGLSFLVIFFFSR